MPESVFSPQLNLQFAEGVKWFYFKENCTFSKDPEGFQHFPGGGGVQLFPGGGGGFQMLISKETHTTCDFPGGWGVRPLSPWIDT